MAVYGLRRDVADPCSVSHDVEVSADVVRAIAARHRGGVEKHSADLPVVLSSGHRRRLDVSTETVVAELAGNAAWVTLFGVQDDPDVRATTTALYEVFADVGRSDVSLTLSLVCTSARGVTPAHMDVADVLLLQLRGTKLLGTGSFLSRRETETELRRRFGPGRENLRRLPDVREEWPLGPGDGVFIPAYTPHWAHAGDEVSVALSVAVSSPRQRRRLAAHEADAVFVRRGLPLLPPGRVAALDRARVHALAAARRMRALTR